MINRRGQFFALYWVLLTFVMCSLSILVYLYQQDNLHSSLISPREVFVIRDDLEDFEKFESKVAVETYLDVRDDEVFGTESFVSSFREKFLQEIYDDPKFSSYLTKDVSVNGRYLGDDFGGKSFFEEVLYPKESFFFGDDGLEFSRKDITKFYYLRADGREKLNFDMELSYTFGSSFFIRESGDRVIVSKNETINY